MKASEKKAIEQWAARLSDAQLEQAYYDAAYDTLGSLTEEMYDRGYDMADIREQEALEKYQDEKADLLGEICEARGIRLWVERQDAPTIEAEPVRHGRWMLCTEGDWNKETVCSCCNGVSPNGWYWKYCPHCGAKMD